MKSLSNTEIDSISGGGWFGELMKMVGEKVAEKIYEKLAAGVKDPDGNYKGSSCERGGYCGGASGKDI